jgi:hypothetical protein
MLKLTILQRRLRITHDSCRSTLPMAIEIVITFYSTRWSHLCYGNCEERIRAHTFNKVNLQRIRADLRDMHIHIYQCHRWQSHRNYVLQGYGSIYVTDDVRNLPLWLRKSYKAIYGQWLCIDSTMITEFFCLLMGRVQEVEQWLQIVWQLRKGCIITMNVLNWLAGTIRDYHCQLLQSAPDWTTESDLYVRRGSHPHHLYSISPNIRKWANTDVPIRWHTKRVFRNTMEMIFIL